MGADGDVSVTAAGRINNSGAITSSGNVAVAAQNIFNTGDIISSAEAGAVSITASNMLVNSGLLYGSGSVIIDALGFYNAPVEEAIGEDGQPVETGGRIMTNTLTISAVAGHNAGLIDAGNYEITMRAAPEGLNRTQLGLPEVFVTVGGDLGQGPSRTISTGLSNEFVNSGVLHSYGVGSINAKNVVNAASGSIESDYGLTITSEHFLNEGAVSTEHYGEIIASGEFINKGSIVAAGASIFDETTEAEIGYNAPSIQAGDL